MFKKDQDSIVSIIYEYCRENDLPEIDFQWKGIPFSGHWGISTSFFQLASTEAKTGKKVIVPQRAQEHAEAVAKKIGTFPGFEQFEAVRGYLNCYFSTTEYVGRVIDTVLEEGKLFGHGEDKNQRVMVEYSQPNTHKAFHVGHLRNVILGSAVCNILDFAGYDVIRSNYIGDIGLHVIKWMWNYLKHHNGEEPTENITQWMGSIYSEADQYYSHDPEVEKEVRALFSRWDQRDEEIVALWKKTRDWSMKGFDQVYELLGVKFDHVYYESEVEDSGKDIVDTLIKKKIARDERPDGAVIIPLDELLGEKEKYRVLVILRSDGTSLYATKDLPLAINKIEEYKLDKSVYVIDVRQSLYMQQIFKTLELMGYEWAKNLFHLAYEIVNLPGNVTMSSRDGTVVLLEDLIEQATSQAMNIVEEKNPELSAEEKRKVAQAVALGGIRYSMLSRDNTKIVTFDWKSALDINGQAAPYIQYAYVRANSILRKTDGQIPAAIPLSYELTTEEVELIDCITRFPMEVQRAANDYHPLYLSTHAYELASLFNSFYRNCPVLKAEPEIRDLRLRIVAATRQAIENALAVLGIEAPNVM
ncbi:MAG: arginine--tRNA ligase [Anaerolineaceae bacterium]|nr:arginine--tRNA ligase [Anaerolineaceae bacterium]